MCDVVVDQMVKLLPDNFHLVLVVNRLHSCPFQSRIQVKERYMQ